jgi:hypothetical protein
MFSKTSFLILILLFCSSTAFCQTTDLSEKKPVVFDGIEYGYLVKNEQLRIIQGEQFSRFEITLYVTNKSGCTKLYAQRTTYRTDDYANLLATFNCVNANVKRLTSKSGTVNARDFYVPVKIKENGKEVTESVKAGYMFRNGETINTNIIVLVPKNERPVFQCTVNNLREL